MGRKRPVTKGRCAYCGADVPIKRDGFPRPHTVESNWGTRRCPGVQTRANVTT